MLADETGLPVGIKSAVGDMAFWHELVRLMRDTGRGGDFVSIHGGEGGTGASPLVFTDAVSTPFRLGFSRVYWDNSTLRYRLLRTAARIVRGQR